MLVTYPANRCDTRYETFSHVPLDMIFLCISHPTMSEYLPSFRFHASDLKDCGDY